MNCEQCFATYHLKKMLVLATLQTILFLLNLHNFGYGDSFDNPIFAVGLLYCILFLLLYIVCL
jgi:hypothetical protein